MPNENIERCIKKAAGSEDKNSYEEMVYEGYGPNGVAVIIESLTDNRNRTAGDLRHYFDKCGGNLGQNGCVSYLFTKKGQIVIDNSEGELDEEKVMEDCFDAGAEDVDFDEDTIEVYTGVNGAARGARGAGEEGLYLPFRRAGLYPQHLHRPAGGRRR